MRYYRRERKKEARNGDAARIANNGRANGNVNTIIVISDLLRVFNLLNRESHSPRAERNKTLSRITYRETSLASIFKTDEIDELASSGPRLLVFSQLDFEKKILKNFTRLVFTVAVQCTPRAAICDGTPVDDGVNTFYHCVLS